jgi:hypothetical protein
LLRTQSATLDLDQFVVQASTPGSKLTDVFFDGSVDGSKVSVVIAERLVLRKQRTNIYALLRGSWPR